jgi:hypothetical protein
MENNMARTLAILSLLLAFASAAQADQIFTATLLPGNEVPPHSDEATGFITVDLHNDLNTLDVMETFSNLASPATAAHIHCCVPIGSNAGVKLPFSGFPNVTSGTYTQTFNLNIDLISITPAAFIAGLQGGMAYANIHDATYPGGDIRGQLAAVPEPSSVILLGSGIVALVIQRRKQRTV